jgi:hypothetical protein
LHISLLKIEKDKKLKRNDTLVFELTKFAITIPLDLPFGQNAGVYFQSLKINVNGRSASYFCGVDFLIEWLRENRICCLRLELAGWILQ